MRKIMENDNTLQWCLDNPFWINQEYQNIIQPKPKIEWVFEKDLRNGGLWDKLGLSELLDKIWIEVKKATNLWIKLVDKLFWIDLWVSEDDYYQEWRNEQDLDYYGSLNLETKRQLLWTIKKAIDNWRDIETFRQEIIKIDNVIFGWGRAKTIAITEIHRAYEWWKFTPMLKLRDEWKIVQKFRLTCNDDRVRENHMQAQDEGRVDLEYIYPSLWVKVPPWWFNCRCSLLFNVL